MSSISQSPIEQKAVQEEREKHLSSKKVDKKAFKALMEIPPIDEEEQQHESFLSLVGQWETKELNNPTFSSEEKNGVVISFAPQALQAMTEQTGVAPVSSVSELHVFFDTLVDHLVHIDQKGISETTITYASKDAASSPLHNTQIIVTEFSTAPKAFNVQIATSPEAAILMQKHLPALAATFHRGKYCFKIERFDISLKKPEKQTERAGGVQPIEKNESVG